MRDRARIFDDITGLAGGAFSALSGLKEELRALVTHRVDEVLSALELVRREEFDAMSDLARHAREETEKQAQRIEALEARVSILTKESSHVSKKSPD